MDPNDDMLNHKLLDAPPNVAERGTAQWLAIEYSVVRDLINGRVSMDDSDAWAQGEDIDRWTDAILERMRRADRLDELRAMPYRKYLRTPEWQERRSRALSRAHGRCQTCNGDKHLEVHHRTYERLGEERDRGSHRPLRNVPRAVLRVQQTR